jgi:deoxyribodipyrimidine photo-lyase
VTLRGLHWFRNDLRLRDNTALNALFGRAEEWLPVFVLDPRLVRREQSVRMHFLLDCLGELAAKLAKRGVPMLVRRGRPETLIPRVLRETGARLLSYNEDSTPFGRRRDDAVERAVERTGVAVISRFDRGVFAPSEIHSGSGEPYKVYTPFRNRWWERWSDEPRPPARLARVRPAIPGFACEPIPTARDLRLPRLRASLPNGGERAALRRLDRFLKGAAARYQEDRDRPDRDGTSRLSPYLRFGAISPRQCFDKAERALRREPSCEPGIRKWLDELIWREFYAATLAHHPRVLRENHRQEYASLRWNEDPEGLQAWCQGRTGFPIVDAGMRQLLATGWMHNRVRMIVASFLTKDLLIDWRAGERFFMQHLVDGDPASNNGGWQWAASTGTDPQPYFRIFNPVRQGLRCDPEGRYVRRWIPELAGVPAPAVHEPWTLREPPAGYPAPIVDHAERRGAALARYRAARAAAHA